MRCLRRKKNTAATGSRVRLPGAGHRHGPRCHGWRSGEGARARHRCPAAHSPAVKDRSTYSGTQRPARGVGARCHHAARQPAPRPARAGPATAVRQHRGPPDTPSLAASPRWPSSWCVPRGRALTQESCGSTLRSLARREKARRGTAAGAAKPLTSRSGKRSAEPLEGVWGREESAARAERSGAGASRCAPRGADW